MKAFEEVLTALEHEDLESYRETMKYCDTRVTADEGIPAIIGLDDLTASWDTVYEGSAADQELSMAMAMGAIVFASLYEESDKEKLGNYPAIAPAMSAAAEKFFRADGDGNVVPYREVIKDFLKESNGQEAR